MSANADENDETSLDEIDHDEEQWYQNVRQVGYEEVRGNDGDLLSVRLKMAADFMERGAKTAIHIDTETFTVVAKAGDRHNELVFSTFSPDRDDEFRGISRMDFPLFWEAVGYFDKRGFRVNTGCMEYGGEQEGFQP